MYIYIFFRGGGGGGGGLRIGESRQNWTRSFLCILGSFLKVNVEDKNIFCVAKISNIFWGA